MGGKNGKSTRLKTPAADYQVPADRGEANDLVEQVGAYQRELDRMQSKMNDKLAQIKAEYEAVAAPKKDAIERALKGLRDWSDANRDALLKGSAKSFELPAGVVGWRMRPPRIVMMKGSIAKLLESLKALNLTRFIRVKEEIDKEALLREPTQAESIPGVKIVQTEEFYVEPFKAELSALNAGSTQP